MRQSLPAPMTPLANPRMTLQRMPSSQNLPPLPQSPQQRFANPTAQLPTVSAALGHGQVNNSSTPPTTGDSKLEVLTTKFIKDHCVADQAASTVRGELYATYVDHMRNVHSILSGSVQMFCNTLKWVSNFEIQDMREPRNEKNSEFIIIYPTEEKKKKIAFLRGRVWRKHDHAGMWIFSHTKKIE